MRNYIEHIKNNNSPHERRLYAMRIAGALTAALFAVWLGTLGVRLASQNVAQSPDQSSDTSLTAAAAASQTTNEPRLDVSNESVYGN